MSVPGATGLTGPGPARLLRRLAAAVYLGVAVAGRISGPLTTMLVVAAVCAALVATAWAAAHVALRDRTPPRGDVVLAAAAAFGAPFYAHGAAALHGLGAVLTLTLLACLVIAGHHRDDVEVVPDVGPP